jgi:ABC-type phosphate/phosphonate transport system substrate-binding protein
LPKGETLRVFNNGHRHQFHLSRRVVLRGFTGLVTASPSLSNEIGFSFGLTPVFLDNDMRYLSLLQRYLMRQLGRPVALVRRRSQREMVEMLISGQLHAAWISDLAYVQYQNRLTVLAIPLFRNQPLYQSYIIVNEASTARTFDDIRGTQHAFSDPDTMAGYLMTRWLLGLRQETPAGFFKHFFFTYGDRNTIRAVATGLAESGTVDGYVWEVMKDREPDLVERTRVVFRSEPFGFPPIAMLETSNELPTEQELGTAFLSMTSQPLGPEILSRLALDGFTTLGPELYANTAEKWRVLQAQE